MNMKKKFPSPVIQDLKYYVYIYSHPTTNEVFYVGQGKGNRVFSHLNDESESQKVKYIKELKSQNLEPKIEILIHGLEDKDSALRVEASIIDILGIKNLTNKQIGYKSALYGRMALEQVNSAYDRQKVNIEEPAVLIRINRAFRHSISEMELYDYTRGQWRLNPNNASKAKYAFAVYQGIVQEVYEVIQWYEAGKTYSVRQGIENIERKDEDVLKGRYEFVGNYAPDKIRDKYKFKSVEHYFKKHNSNPIKYENFN